MRLQQTSQVTEANKKIFLHILIRRPSKSQKKTTMQTFLSKQPIRLQILFIKGNNIIQKLYLI